MEPQLIGYFPKQTAKRPDCLKAANVKEICSASDCISKSPDNWIDFWKHNELWVYDSPEIAWSIVPEEKRAIFDLYAYRMFPCQFVEGKQEVFEIPGLQVASLPEDFKSLGWDSVSRSMNNKFECSPLSCNYLATEIVTNEFCLLNNACLALQTAKDFSLSKPEPGPYFVLEVFRKM